MGSEADRSRVWGVLKTRPGGWFHEKEIQRETRCSGMYLSHALLGLLKRNKVEFLPVAYKENARGVVFRYLWRAR